LPFTLRGEVIHTGTIYPGVSGWWMGLAGEISDRAGNPVFDVQIKIWDGEGYVQIRRPNEWPETALKYQSAFGGSKAWWEQFLPINCIVRKTYHVQVLRDGVGVSPIVTVETMGDCSKGLIIINFQKNY
jgi:hypothetical protein